MINRGVHSLLRRTGGRGARRAGRARRIDLEPLGGLPGREGDEARTYMPLLDPISNPILVVRAPGGPAGAQLEQLPTGLENGLGQLRAHIDVGCAGYDIDAVA